VETEGLFSGSMNQFFCLPFSLMAHSYPTQTPSSISVWCATGRLIWILRLTQLCGHSWLELRVKQFVKSHDLTNRSHAHDTWLLKTYAIPSSMYASQIRATPFLRQGREMDNPLQNGFWQCWLKGFSESETPLLRGVLCESVAWSLCNLTVFTLHFFFFWWGLLHGPQQGPDRMKEKT
jgi:hypothetical protein